MLPRGVLQCCNGEISRSLQSPNRFHQLSLYHSVPLFGMMCRQYQRIYWPPVTTKDAFAREGIRRLYSRGSAVGNQPVGAKRGESETLGLLTRKSASEAFYCLSVTKLNHVTDSQAVATAKKKPQKQGRSRTKFHKSLHS